MMRKFHPENERLKRNYLQHVSQARGQSQSTIDQIAAAIDRFQNLTDYKPFRKFHIEQVKAFRLKLDKEVNKRTGKPIGASTRRTILATLKGFFHWLADQPGFKSRISHSDCEYFNLDNRSAALANAKKPKQFPSVQQIEHVLDQMPDETQIQKRDKALIAFVLLTGARANAVASAKLCHVDISDRQFYQDAQQVRTKFSKTIQTWFFLVSDKAEAIFLSYYQWLTADQLFGPSDPLFPKTRNEYIFGKGFQVTGLDRKHWQGTNTIRKIFRKAFEDAGLPYYNPHSFRDTLAHEAKLYCTNLQEHQAWSQNLGHADLLTTIQSYGPVLPDQQKEIIRRLKKD